MKYCLVEIQEKEKYFAQDFKAKSIFFKFFNIGNENSYPKYISEIETLLDFILD